MTITVVCDVLGKENNGTTIAAMNLIRFLKSKGHVVRVLCADADKKGLPDYFVVPINDLGVFQNYVEKNGVTLAKPERDVINAALDGADVVHIMMPFSLGQATAKIAQKKHIPISAGFHLLAENISTHVFLSKSKLFNRATYAIFHKMYKRCDSIHYVTQ